MAEEAQNFEYATKEDLPSKKNFTKARKAGYVEDEVDGYVDEVLTKYTEFLNNYNSLLYQFNLLKSETESARVTEAPVSEDTVAVVVEEPASAEVTVNDASSASRRAREIMDEAAAEASEHVTRALDRVARIEAEAVAEATEIRAEARAVLSAAEVRAEAIVTEAQNAATGILDAANAQKEEAAAIEAQAIEQRNSIFSRLELFYASQLETVRAEKSGGYLPVPADVTPVAEEAPSTVVEDGTLVEENATNEEAPVSSSDSEVK